MDINRQIKIVRAMLGTFGAQGIDVTFDKAAGDNGSVCIDHYVFIEPMDVPVKTLTGTINRPGWYAYTYQHQNNYPHAPDDVWDQEIIRTESFDTAAIEAIVFLVRTSCRNRPCIDEELAENGFENFMVERDGKGQDVFFCWTIRKDEAGYFRTWREVHTKTEIKRYDVAYRRTKAAAAEIARRRYNKFIGANDA